MPELRKKDIKDLEVRHLGRAKSNLRLALEAMSVSETECLVVTEKDFASCCETPDQLVSRTRSMVNNCNPGRVKLFRLATNKACTEVYVWRMR